MKHRPSLDGMDAARFVLKWADRKRMRLTLPESEKEAEELLDEEYYQYLEELDKQKEESDEGK